VTLDLARIIDEIDELVASVDPERDRGRFDALRHTWATLDSADVNRRFQGAKTSFLLARGAQDYRDQRPAPPAPIDYSVIATDGSLIAPDRHSPARFFLMNVGAVRLTYGSQAGASISSTPHLGYRDDDLFVPGDVRRIPINHNILNLRRAVAELATAAELMSHTGERTLALQDGTLILWSLEGQADSVRNWVLGDYLTLLRLFRDRRWPLASYISAPASTDLMNTLRVAVCDYPPQGRAINCDACRGRIETEGHTPACDILPGVTDRYLVADIACLRPGERSAVYDSSSRILESFTEAGEPELHICFFYLHAGREVARVEIPRYVAQDAELLDFVHAAIFDQCRLGRGYPTVLQEAHEAAVLSFADRQAVEMAVERALARVDMVMLRTGKDRSKRDRAI
jgi:hypothetical protein